MAKVYVSINGDSVGAKIADAIQSNDPEAVRQTSADFNAAHAEIDKWVEAAGGRVISASGDEAIYELEDTQVGQIESLMDKYQAKTGHTLTAGIGPDMLSSVKAMTYGKMHDPGQMIEYDQEVENGLAPQEEAEAEQIAGGAEGEGAQPPHEQGLSPEENLAHDAEEQEDDEQDPDNIEADEEPAAFGGNTEPVDGDVDQDIEESADNQAVDQAAQSQNPAAQQNAKPAPGAAGAASSNLQQAPVASSKGPAGLPAQQAAPKPAAGLPSAASAPLEATDNSQTGANVDPNAQQHDDQVDASLSDAGSEGAEQQDQEDETAFGGDPAQPAAQGQSPILDMIHANADDGEDQPQGEEQFGDEDEEGFDDGSEDPNAMDDGMQDLSPEDIDQEDGGMGEDPAFGAEGEEDQGSLKAKVAQTLQNFTLNKDKINAMQQTDPEMYQSVIEMINRMIEMAKQLNVSPDGQEEDLGMEGQEGEEQFSDEEFPEDGEEEGLDPEAEGEGEIPSEEEEEEPEFEEEEEETEAPAPAKKPEPKGKGFPPKK